MIPGAGARPLAERLARRAALLARIRAWFAGQGVTEVDTPLRAPHALPEAHIRPLACDGGVLLASPELWMKQLLAAGSGDIYQLGHVFRAGERGRWHSEEFLLCEWYRLGFDLHALMADVAGLLEHCGLEGARDGPQLRYEDAFLAHAGVHPLASAEALAGAARDLGLAPRDAGEADAAFWRDLLMGLCVQPRLGSEAPLWLTDYPAGDSPLARRRGDDPRWALRFEVFWQGVELANGCCEEGDAVEIAARLGTGGGSGATGPESDEGRWQPPALPDCGGVALGVDRLLMLLEGRPDIAAVQALPPGDPTCGPVCD